MYSYLLDARVADSVGSLPGGTQGVTIREPRVSFFTNDLLFDG